MEMEERGFCVLGRKVQELCVLVVQGTCASHRMEVMVLGFDDGAVLGTYAFRQMGLGKESCKSTGPDRSSPYHRHR